MPPRVRRRAPIGAALFLPDSSRPGCQRLAARFSAISARAGVAMAPGACEGVAAPRHNGSEDAALGGGIDKMSGFAARRSGPAHACQPTS